MCYLLLLIIQLWKEIIEFWNQCNVTVEYGKEILCRKVDCSAAAADDDDRYVTGTHNNADDDYYDDDFSRWLPR